jgi:hypothetical protein
MKKSDFLVYGWGELVSGYETRVLQYDPETKC